jgi:hypothetical protein
MVRRPTPKGRPRKRPLPSPLRTLPAGVSDESPA